MDRDRGFQIANSTLRFGWGVTAEVGEDLRERNARRTMLVIDPAVAATPVGEVVEESLRRAGVDFAKFDGVRVEPTQASFMAAAEFARDGQFDAFLAVGGGSTLDTAKAANLYATYPADFLTYVNPPLGAGQPPPGPLKPLIAVPTTAGTGSESTGTAIFDWPEKNLKTGIAHRRLKPVLAIVDPENTRTQPAAVAASAGLDVLSHALESYTALPYDQRPRPSRPAERPAYQGSNPISDLWALEALRLVHLFLGRAVSDPEDDEAREKMLLAAAMAGIGFGNAGVHVPHAMGYPVAGLAKQYQPPGYTVDHPLVPHGISVIVHLPAVIRGIGNKTPQATRRAVGALGGDIGLAMEVGGAKALAERILEFMRELDMPNGLAALGLQESDIPALVEGTLQQQRLLKLAPVPVGEAELSEFFRDSLNLW
jgi:hydroxyacid-oxoacid transhydrogenase